MKFRYISKENNPHSECQMCGESNVWPTIPILIISLFLGGCQNQIIGIGSITGPGAGVYDVTATMGVSSDDPFTLSVDGRGTCGAVGVDWGDGTEVVQNGNFDASGGRILFQHRYGDHFPPDGLVTPRRPVWPGFKTIHAYSASNCIGEASMRVRVVLKGSDLAGNTAYYPTFKIGLGQPTPTACNVVPNSLPLRAGATVNVSEIPNPNNVIDFGCLFSGCVNGIEGNSGPTNPAFPFPNMRRHSLVLRIVGSAGLDEQIVQGQANTSFVVERGGPLELCVNDDVLSDNTGAWGIQISVDETTAH